ncbi:MAG: restriction endonuclease subunit S [Verrucomicrobiaceae bacterium]|nr:MAG: restriction endonuclease subunit S [Verrucomicrobiaceae bacterium]
MAASLPSFDHHRPNPDWASLPLFDRTGWRRMAFGDFAESIGERAEPKDAQEEIYVGLEHLDSQCLHIRRWGKGSDVTGTKLRFRKGDIIFGRRRAYQRKLAVAEFDGICSAHALVVRAKPKIVLPEFLPFLMMSDRFMNRAVEISVGSLSPTINWTTLKLETFDLPPIDQQRRIAEILWAVDEVIQTGDRLQTSILDARDTFFDDELRKGQTRSPETMKNLGMALVRIIAGKSPKASSEPATMGEYGVLKVSAAGDGQFVETENKALLSPDDFDESLEVKPGMILVTRCNAVLAGIGRACVVERTRPGLMLSDKTLQLVPNEGETDRGFLLQGLRSDPYRGFVERSSNGTEAKNVSQETLKASPFWLPPIAVQRRISERLNEFVQAADATTLNLKNQIEIRTAIKNNIFA